MTKRNQVDQNSQSKDEDLGLLPCSTEAERALLGSLLIDAESVWDSIQGLVREEDFMEKRNQVLFRVFSQMAEEKINIDAVTVTEFLQITENLDDIGGMSYLVEIAGRVPFIENSVDYAKIIHNKAVERNLIFAGQKISELPRHPQGEDANGLLLKAEKTIADLMESQKIEDGNFLFVKDVLPTILDRIEDISKLKKTVTGLPTGFPDLDEKTSGLHPGQLVIVAGRPGMGKTAFAMNMVEHISCQEGKKVAFFSMEMPVEELLFRQISSIGRVHLQRIRTGNISGEDWPKISLAIRSLLTSFIYIDESPTLTPSELRIRAKQLQKKSGLDLIVIDYLQLMSSKNNRRVNRVEEISEISRSLKALAKELGIPIIALSQLNRGLESRVDKRPQVSDLRESGAIEQDADLILFLYREEVYKKDDEELKGIAEIIIGKQRNGPIGTIRVNFIGEFSRFENPINGNGYDYSY